MTSSRRGKLQNSMSASTELIAGSGGTASTTMTTINLITGGLGAGILSLPWAIAGASIVCAVVLNALVLALNAWTIMLLIRAGERHQRFDLGALLEMLPGRLGIYAKPVCNLCIWGTMFLCLIGYFIVVEDAVTYVVPDDVTPGFLDYRSTWGAAIALLLIPLCFLDMKYLSFTSALSVLVNIYLFGYLVYQFQSFGWEPQDQSCFFGLSSGTFTFFSVLMFSIIIQMCVLPMYEQLEDRTPDRFQTCVMVAFGFLFVFTMLFGACAYMIFGVQTASNILKNFPREWPADVARVGMCLVVLGVYPIMLSPMVAPIRTWEVEKASRQPFHYRKIDDLGYPGGDSLHSLGSLRETAVKPSRLWSTVSTLVVLFASMGVSFFVSDLGLMNVINGAISVTMFVAFCPTMVGLYLGDPPSTLKRVLLCGLFIFGLSMSAAGFVFTDNNASALVSNCMVPF